MLPSIAQKISIEITCLLHFLKNWRTRIMIRVLHLIRETAMDITIFWVSETSISVLLYDVMSPCWCDSFQRRRRSLWSLPIPKNVINFLSREEGLSIFLEPFLRDWTVWVDSTLCTVVLCWITRSFALKWSTYGDLKGWSWSLSTFFTSHYKKKSHPISASWRIVVFFGIMKVLCKIVIWIN